MSCYFVNSPLFIILNFFKVTGWMLTQRANVILRKLLSRMVESGVVPITSGLRKKQRICLSLSVSPVVVRLSVTRTPVQPLVHTVATQ